MRARTATAVLLLGVSALGLGACGSSDDAAGTVNEPITVGTNEVAVAGDTDAAAGGDSAAAGETAAEGGEAAAGDPAAGKEVFAAAGCSGCHTLADAGAAGAVGPNLSD